MYNRPNKVRISQLSEFNLIKINIFIFFYYKNLVNDEINYSAALDKTSIAALIFPSLM
jgi:hypothetical protein